MIFLTAKTYDELSSIAADIISKQLLQKPESVLGLATGSTPLGTYSILVSRCNNHEIDFSRATTFNLDEYCGLEASHEQSYRRYMQDNLFSHINIPPQNAHVPNGMAFDIDGECLAYDALINACGGIDLQLLGIGLNGHIGFNEPGSNPAQSTHRVTLTQSTLEANARFFNSIDEVPTHAITMGIAQIMQAKRILLLAAGEAKHAILHAALYGPVTPEIPASVLQKHVDLTVVYCGD